MPWLMAGSRHGLEWLAVRPVQPFHGEAGSAAASVKWWAEDRAEGPRGSLQNVEGPFSQHVKGSTKTSAWATSLGAPEGCSHIPGPELPSRPRRLPGTCPGSRHLGCPQGQACGRARASGGNRLPLPGLTGWPRAGHLQRLLCLPPGERRPTAPLCPWPDEAAHPSVSGASRLQCQPWDLSPHLCLEGSNGCRECSLAAHCVPSWQSGRRVSCRLCHQS